MKHYSIKKFFWICLVAVWVPFQAHNSVLRSQEKPSPGLDKVHFGFTKNLLADVKSEDALAATLAWAKTIGVEKGFWSGAEANILHDQHEILALLNSSTIDVAGMLTQEYLELQDRLNAEPIITYVQAGSHAVEYVLFVHRGSNIENLDDLRGKSIAILSRGSQNTLADRWCNVLLMENGFSEVERHCKTAKYVHKASQAILPAFFRQVDAAITTRSAFNMSIELNPQLGQKLKIIASSNPLVPVVVCVRKDLSSEVKTRYIEKSITLHEDPGSFQTFLLFKVNRLVAWQPHYLESVKNLLNKEDRLRAKLGVDPGQRVSMEIGK